MRFGLSIFGCSAGLVVLACGVFAPDLHAQGTQRSTRSVSSSETNSLEIFKTLKGLDLKQDGLKQLDDELSKSLQPFTSRGSVDTTMPSSYQAPRMPVIKSRRSKEQLDQAKGWVWDAEAVMSGSSGNDASVFPGLSSNPGSDGKQSSWGQFSDRSTQDGVDSSGLRNKANVQRDANSDDDSTMPGGIREVAKVLRGKLETESVGSIFNPSTTRSSAMDFFGQPLDSGPASAQIQAHKDYIDQYQRIIGSGSTPNSSFNADFFKSAAVPNQPGKSAGLDSLPGSSRRDLLTTAPGTPSVLIPATVPDVNANVLNQWNPMYTTALPEPPKSLPFFAPPVEIPRRKF